jgi:hypothetical protein
MSATMNSTKQTGRSRVMIVDPEWQFGLKLAGIASRPMGTMQFSFETFNPCSPSSGRYSRRPSCLVRDSCDEKRGTAELDTLRALNVLCPQAPILTVVEPMRDALGTLSPPIDARPRHQAPLVHNRVEELLRANLGIPCVRASLT